MPPHFRRVESGVEAKIGAGALIYDSVTTMT